MKKNPDDYDANHNSYFCNVFCSCRYFSNKENYEVKIKKKNLCGWNRKKMKKVTNQEKNHQNFHSTKLAVY